VKFGLPDLSQFLVVEIRSPANDENTIIVGQFSHLASVRNDGGWLYRYPGPSLPGSLSRVPTALGESVEFVTPDATFAPELRPGVSYPWVDQYWQAYHIDMVQAGQWEYRKFVATPAQYYRLNGVRGWQPLGASLPPEAEDLGVRPGGWDHEHCEICRKSIGASGDSHGYVDPSEHWLCETCHQKYAAPRDISFAVET